MKKTVLATALVFSLLLAAAATERRDADLDRIHSAGTVLDQIMSAPDSAIPDSIMSGAKCIAIMPSMLKAGFIFGANYGKGVATCRTGKGWSAPAFFKLTGGSFGFQAGGQASDLVLIVRTDEGMQHLLQSKFKLGADASAAAGPVGRDAQAATDLSLRAQVLTYSRSRGLFLGVSLSGGVINQDQADTRAFYGKDWSYRSVLGGDVPPPQDADALLRMVEKYAPTPKPPRAAAPTPSAQAAPPATTTGAVTTASNTAPPSMSEPSTVQAPATSDGAMTATAESQPSAAISADSPEQAAGPAEAASAPVAPASGMARGH